MGPNPGITAALYRTEAQQPHQHQRGDHRLRALGTHAVRHVRRGSLRATARAAQDSAASRIGHGFVVSEIQIFLKVVIYLLNMVANNGLIISDVSVRIVDNCMICFS